MSASRESKSNRGRVGQLLALRSSPTGDPAAEIYLLPRKRCRQNAAADETVHWPNAWPILPVPRQPSHRDIPPRLSAQKPKCQAEGLGRHENPVGCDGQRALTSWLGQIRISTRCMLGVGQRIGRSDIRLNSCLHAFPRAKTRKSLSARSSNRGLSAAQPS